MSIFRIKLNSFAISNEFCLVSYCIIYFKNYYGLTEDETETVLNMFLKELSHMIYSEMEKHKTF